MSMAPDNTKKYDKTRLAAFLAASLAVLFVLIKGSLYYSTGAASFLASLLDSAMDLGLSGIMWMGLKYASKPADANHRYGHGKMEALLGFIQSLIIGGAALALAWQAGVRFKSPVLLTPDIMDIASCVFILVGTLFLVMFQTRIIKETGSLAIQGDRAHYIGDLSGNVGLLLLLVVNAYHPISWLDPLFCTIIAITLFYMAGEVARGAVNVLLDHEVDDLKREEILQASLDVQGVRGVHDLRVIEAGVHLHISLDIEVDPSLSLVAAHDIALLVEKTLLRVAPGAEIMIHIDPEGALEDSRHETLEPHHFQ